MIIRHKNEITVTDRGRQINTLVIPLKQHDDTFAVPKYSIMLFTLKRKFIFLLSTEECNRFHTDKVLKILSNAETIKLNGETGGALCTCLMAIQHINSDEPVVICNSDQLIDYDLDEVISYFQMKKADCGLVCFQSVHPRWSYVREVDEEVVEAAEKRPITSKAIAGFYYFAHGKDFIECAKSAILNKRVCDGKYYISETINEMVLRSKKVFQYTIPTECYHSFYSPQCIDNFERLQRHEDI